MPAYSLAPAAEARRFTAASVPPRATGARAQWLRDTWGGKLAAMMPQPDEAAEMAAARDLADRHELTYGRRPEMAECLHKVRGSGTGSGVVLRGETAEVVAAIRYANPDFPIQMVVGADPASVQVGGIVTSPGGAPQLHGDPATAAAMYAQLARRQ
jgi:hypothetical protein